MSRILTPGNPLSGGAPKLAMLAISQRDFHIAAALTGLASNPDATKLNPEELSTAAVNLGDMVIDAMKKSQEDNG